MLDQYKSPTRKLISFFNKSRDKWKEKCINAKKEIKNLKNNLRYLKNKNQDLKDENSALRKRLAEITNEAEVLKKNKK